MIRNVAYRATRPRLGALLPCCDPSTGFFSQLMSDTCRYCTDADRAQVAVLMQNENNADNTSGVPCCDPTDGAIANLFSNTCNVCNPIGDTLGLSAVPTWAWAAGGVGLLFLLMRNR